MWVTRADARQRGRSHRLVAAGWHGCDDGHYGVKLLQRSSLSSALITACTQDDRQVFAGLFKRGVRRQEVDGAGMRCEQCWHPLAEDKADQDVGVQDDRAGRHSGHHRGL